MSGPRTSPAALRAAAAALVVAAVAAPPAAGAAPLLPDLRPASTTLRLVVAAEAEGGGGAAQAVADEPADRPCPAPALLAEAEAPRGEGEQGAKRQPQAPAAGQPGSAPTAKQGGDLDFDLLGAPPPPAPGAQHDLRLRREMLTAHQAMGFGLVALQLATTVVGQLNYDDRFNGGGSSTGRYQQTHAILAYSTAATFAATGLLALLAPSPITKREGFDRVTLHKIAMFTAAAGMITQVVLGAATRNHEGRLDQPDLATAHLVVGYVTLAATLTGVGAIVF